MVLEKDVAIIGAGPVGLFAVFQCGMLGLSTIVVDALDDLGGQCTALYPEKPIYDIPAYPEITGANLIGSLVKQAEPFASDYLLSRQVVALEKKQDGEQEYFILETSKGDTLKVKSVLIAAGAGAFGPNRPPLETIEHYEGHSVFYYVKDPKRFYGEDVVIAGGGDSAIDWAVALAPNTRSLTLVHRRDKFRASPSMVEKMRALSAAGKITLKTGFQLSGLDGEGLDLKNVILRTLDGQEERIEARYLLPFFGLANDLGPISAWGLQSDNKDIHVDPLTQETNIKGVFAVGDICFYPKKLKLILTGFSEVATAAHEIRSYLNPDQSFHFEHSTTKGIPKKTC